MKVFLPFKRELNPYLDEIILNSSNNFIYDHYLNHNDSYDIVHIHWPEAIFNWLEPNELELKRLKIEIKKWKTNSIVIYTKHDFQRNKGTTVNFTLLFQLIEDNADIFIHMGEYSRKLYKPQYPGARHELIYHPLFNNSLKPTLKEVAKKKLGIPQNSTVIIAPGNIRSASESNLVLNSFSKLMIKNKVLICTNMRFDFKFDFPGRIRLKKYFDIKRYFFQKFIKKYSLPEYLFNYNRLDNDRFALMVSASDIVLVPRINILNSGILFLGLTFNKVVIGPSVGNVREHLIHLGFPIFNPKSIKSVTLAMEEGIDLASVINFDELDLSCFSARKIASDYDKLYKSCM